jgi:hypothetical protein
MPWSIPVCRWPIASEWLARFSRGWDGLMPIPVPVEPGVEMIWVAHTWSLFAMCAISTVAHIANCLMYAPPIAKGLGSWSLH